MGIYSKGFFKTTLLVGCGRGFTGLGCLFTNYIQAPPADQLVMGGRGKGADTMKSLGRHLILELFDCPAALLDDPEHVSQSIVKAVERSGATLIKPFFHQFAPQGVSGVAIISESHFSIHTWPEYGYAALDIFTCGDVIDMDAAVRSLKQDFQALSIQKMVLSRGALDLPDEMIQHKPCDLEEPKLARSGG